MNFVTLSRILQEFKELGSSCVTPYEAWRNSVHVLRYPTKSVMDGHIPLNPLLDV